MKSKYHRLTLAKREEISRGLWADENFSQIARRISCYPSAVSREVWGNVKRKRRSYSAIKAQTKADLNRKKCGRKKKLDDNPKLKNYVYEKLQLEWSPEEIANRLKMETGYSISFKAVYKYLYHNPFGWELVKHLRYRGRKRKKKVAIHYGKKDFSVEIRR
ncbi:MAG: helix-turn-helix domain-containing protein [Patescibacteria group bacterium]